MRSLFIAGVMLCIAVGAGQAETQIDVPGNHGSIGEAIEAAPAGATIVVAGGAYREAIIVDRSLTLIAKGRVLLQGDAGPVVSIVDTKDVVVEGFEIVGGREGIFVTRSIDVEIRNNEISGSRIVGVKVRLGSAEITGNKITDSLAPYGVGIHVTNTMDWPVSVVVGNTVENHAKAGIVANMTGELLVTGNQVRRSGGFGVDIREMAHATVAGNHVAAHVDGGIRVLDYAHAQICGNDITTSEMNKGSGFDVDFYSHATLTGNSVAGYAAEQRVRRGSDVTIAAAGC